MPGERQTLDFVWDGGLVEGVAEELVQLPNMTTSRNTRFSRRRGVPYKAPGTSVLTNVQSGTQCGGVVHAGNADSAVAYLLPKEGNKRISAGAASGVRPTVKSNSGAQNAYYPVDMVDSGAASFGMVHLVPACIVHDGNTYVASYRHLENEPDQGGYYLSVFAADGSLLVASHLIADMGAAPDLKWCGLTAHGPNGVRFWYTQYNSANNYWLYGCSISVSGNTASVGTSYPFGASLDDGDALDVVGGSNDYAWLVRFIEGTKVCTVRRIDISVMSTDESVDVATGASNSIGPRVVVNTFLFAGVIRLGLAWCDLANGSLEMRVYNGLDIAAGALITRTEASQYGDVDLQFFSGTNAWVIPVCSDVSGGIAAGNSYKTTFFPTRLDTGDPNPARVIDWMGIHCKGATWRISDTEAYPYFQLSPVYDSPALYTDVEYTEDPCVEVWTFGSMSTFSVVARFGVDRVRQLFPSSSKSATFDEQTKRLTVFYCENRFDWTLGNLGLVARYVTLDFSSRQCRYAIDEAGVSLIAAAQPAYWDGTETCEIGPLRKPKLTATTYSPGPIGLDWPPGTYAVRCVVSHLDAAGQLHRSAPSEPATLTTSNNWPRLHEPTIPSYRNGVRQEGYSEQLFFTEAGPGSLYFGQTFYRDAVVDGVSVYAALVGVSTDYSTAIQGAPNAALGVPLLYSTGQNGQEILPRAPGPWWDVVIVGKRAWAIDAEFRSRLVYSKAKVRGIAHEFNPALEVLFPASAGKLVALSELDGKPIVLSETGVYVVHGEGPNNAGAGLEFVTQRLSDVPCVSRGSVIRTPIGVMFQTHAGFALVESGGGVRVLPQINRDDIYGFAALHRDESEVMFFSATGEALVYNYELDRWSQWNFATPHAAGSQSPFTEKLTLFSNANSRLEQLDPEGVSASGALDIETPWLSPAGPHGKLTVRELVLLCAHGGASHGVQVSVECDFDANKVTTVLFSSADIDALVVDGRYTLRVKLRTHSMRSFRIRLLETTPSGLGCIPISGTVEFSIEQGTQRRAVLQGGIKG